ncbi:MAG: cell division protein FtsZ [Pseudobdellovibrionaceae bacterium]
MFELDENVSIGANIKVVGVGGGGGNAVQTMIEGGMSGAEFIVANTDIQALQHNKASGKIQLGLELTKGLGAGANPDIGRRAAIESYNEIVEKLDGADMVFVTAGMGGGTGTGGAPIVAKIARELGALTIGVVTRPFIFEGKRRMKHADFGLGDLKENVDALIVIPNQKLLAVAGDKTPLIDTFKKADAVLLDAVKGISDLINKRGLINLDFADIRTVMSGKGMAIMGTGYAKGENRAVEAATAAISSPLLENIAIDGATGIIINVTGGPDLSLFEVNEASTLITEAAHEDAEIIFGAVIDESLVDEVRVTVVATGFANYERKQTASHNVGMSEFLSGTQQAPAPAPETTYAQSPAPQAQTEWVQPSASYFQQPVNLPPIPSPSPAQYQQTSQQMAPPASVNPAFGMPSVSGLSPSFPLNQEYQSAPEIQPVPTAQQSPPMQYAAPQSQQQTAPPPAYSSQPQQMAQQPMAQRMQENVQPNEAGLLPRDILLMKAKMFRESQETKVNYTQPEQLSMNVETETSALEEARRMAQELRRAPPLSQNLDIPTYIRRKQNEAEGGPKS